MASVKQGMSISFSEMLRVIVENESNSGDVDPTFVLNKGEDGSLALRVTADEEEFIGLMVQYSQKFSSHEADDNEPETPELKERKNYVE
jgi:hypothetical protein